MSEPWRRGTWTRADWGGEDGGGAGGVRARRQVRDGAAGEVRCDAAEPAAAADAAVDQGEAAAAGELHARGGAGGAVLPEDSGDEGTGSPAGGGRADRVRGAAAPQGAGGGRGEPDPRGAGYGRRSGGAGGQADRRPEDGDHPEERPVRHAEHPRRDDGAGRQRRGAGPAREALPIFLSVLRAYRPDPSASSAARAPAEGDTPPTQPSTKELLGDMHTQVITDLRYRITSLFTVAEYPPPPPTGNEPLTPSAPGAEALRQRDCRGRGRDVRRRGALRRPPPPPDPPPRRGRGRRPRRSAGPRWAGRGRPSRTRTSARRTRGCRPRSGGGAWTARSRR